MCQKRGRASKFEILTLDPRTDSPQPNLVHDSKMLIGRVHRCANVSMNQTKTADESGICGRARNLGWHGFTVFGKAVSS